VLTNLLSNAVKFSVRGATVEISLKRLTEDVRVAVLDRGQGVPAEFRTLIFQRFAQADVSDNRRRGGTGLGLAISKMLTERMGGRIDYYDRPGGGSVFFVDFPEYRN
jgi:signal transduction histidine kinase